MLTRRWQWLAAGSCLGSLACSGQAASDDGPRDGVAGSDSGAVMPPEGVPLGDPWSARAGLAGPLPDRVHLRTNTESFNRRYYFATRDGGIWFAPNAEQTGSGGDWQKMVLPEGIEGRILELSADDNEMIAITTDRQIWTMTGALFDPASFAWKSAWGFPFWTGPGLQLRDGILRWEWSVISREEDIYWIDPAGNQQLVGLAKVSHIWMLDAGQVRLGYNDPWLALDFSYSMCGPKRDRFRAESLTASGSSIFVINRYGDMFTRLYDFDMSGADPVFFQYSYEDQRGVPNAPIQLPSVDWVQHPKIEGTITNLISIHKVGEGAVHRMMRVEGIDPSGAVGYFEKDVVDLDAGAWTFHETGRTLRGIRLDNRPGDASDENLAAATDMKFSRNMDRVGALSALPQIGSVDDWAAELLSFHSSCSPTTLRVHLGSDDSIDLTLHTTDGIRAEPRAPGLDGASRDFIATIEVPPAMLGALGGLSPKARDFVQQYLGARRFTPVGFHATTEALVICPSGSTLDRSCAAPVWTFARDAS